MWNSTGNIFESKADAFDWLNKVDMSKEIDSIKLYCGKELRYTKNPFGIFDEHFQTYVKGLLPVERYTDYPKPSTY